MTRRNPRLAVVYLLVLALCVGDLVYMAAVGDGWRTFGLSLALVLLVVLRRDLTEEESRR